MCPWCQQASVMTLLERRGCQATDSPSSSPTPRPHQVEGDFASTTVAADPKPPPPPPHPVGHCCTCLHLPLLPGPVKDFQSVFEPGLRRLKRTTLPHDTQAHLKDMVEVNFRYCERHGLSVSSRLLAHFVSHNLHLWPSCGMWDSTPPKARQASP